MVMRILNDFKKCFGMSVNETVKPNSWKHNFLKPGALLQVEETVAQRWQQALRIAALQKFQKMIDSSHPPPFCGTDMSHILRRLLLT
jgi:hypothetical protein